MTEKIPMPKINGFRVTQKRIERERAYYALSTEGKMFADIDKILNEIRDEYTVMNLEGMSSTQDIIRCLNIDILRLMKFREVLQRI
jgi:soluble P-type ATPase